MISIKNEKHLMNSLVILRLFIGWHFLYEGIIKLYDPDWTSFGYLASAQGPFRSIFLWMTNEPLIGIADWMNIIVLIFVGLSLILGIFEKWGALAAIVLLALYYLAHPSFPWVTQLNVEGSYWFINKNLIELIACVVIYQIPTGQYFGIKRLFAKSEELTKTETL
ncbi:DoxX family membrane protein [Maribacter halichondriae]|uniref:DoxX family membrane protein n=1 Tax=Maribacter halichondriae TaxID=2980554 RepID=UPI00235899A0|nr:DoxX family membrane protein [Maribacter sp. Hal144]